MTENDPSNTPSRAANLMREFGAALLRVTPAFNPEPTPVVISADAGRFQKLSREVLAGVLHRPVAVAPSLEPDSRAE